MPTQQDVLDALVAFADEADALIARKDARILELEERNANLCERASELGLRLFRLDALLASEGVPAGLQDAVSGHASIFADTAAWEWFRAQFAEEEAAPPTAEEVYGIMHPSHPINGGPGFDAEGRPLAPEPEPLSVGGEQISPGATGPGSESHG